MDRANRRYILTQGPLPHTVSHFWVMVWEQNSMAILMLNKLIEKKMVSAITRILVCICNQTICVSRSGQMPHVLARAHWR